MRSGASDASEAHPLARPMLWLRCAPLVLARAPSRVRHLHRACTDHCAHARLGPRDVSYELCISTRDRDSGLDCAAWFHPGVACNTGLRLCGPRGPSPRSQVRVTHKFPPLINVVHSPPVTSVHAELPGPAGPRPPARSVLAHHHARHVPAPARPNTVESLASRPDTATCSSMRHGTHATLS